MISTYIKINRSVFWSVVITTVFLGVIRTLFLTGQLSAVASSAQTALSVVVFHYVITLFLYREYQNTNIQRFMAGLPIRVIRGVIFIAITVLSCYAVYFFLLRGVYAGS